MTVPAIWVDGGPNSPDGGAWVSPDKLPRNHPYFTTSPQGTANPQNANAHNENNADLMDELFGPSPDKMSREEAQERLDATRGIGTFDADTNQSRSSGGNNGATAPNQSAGEASNNNDTEMPQMALQENEILGLLVEGGFGLGGDEDDFLAPRKMGRPRKIAPLKKKKSDALPQPAIVPMTKKRANDENEDGNEGDPQQPRKRPKYTGYEVCMQGPGPGSIPNNHGVPTIGYTTTFAGYGVQAPGSFGGSGYAPNSLAAYAGLAGPVSNNPYGGNNALPCAGYGAEPASHTSFRGYGPGPPPNNAYGMPANALNNANQFAGKNVRLNAPGNNVGMSAGPAPPRQYPDDVSEPDEGANHINPDAVTCFFCDAPLHSRLFRKHIDDQHRVNGQPPICPECGVCFRAEKLIKHHETKHSVSGTFKEWNCLYPGCEVKFRSRKDQKRHFKEIHKEGARFRCGIVKPNCKEAFRSMAALRDHFATVHPGVRFHKHGFPVE